MSIKHLYEDDFGFSSCNLSILENIAYLSSLQHLRVDCKYGLIVNPEDSDLLERIFAPMTNLKSLSVTSLKGFTVEQFSFLSHLKNLVSLEIGSCLSWTNNNDGKSSLSSSQSPSPPSSLSPSPPSLSQHKHDHQYGHIEPEEEELEDEAIVPDDTADCIITETHHDVPADTEVEIEGEIEGEIEQELEMEGETESINIHQENETKDNEVIKLKG